jgi:hypothetical protein
MRDQIVQNAKLLALWLAGTLTVSQVFYPILHSYISLPIAVFFGWCLGRLERRVLSSEWPIQDRANPFS